MRQVIMTKGNIWKLLIRFAIPLLLGNLLQQLYNAFDAIVVGRYVSNEALAAVGSSGPLVNMIIAFFMGMSAGASVLISQYFGAKDDRTLRQTVHTAMLLAILMGLVMSAVGILATPMLLRWMKAPQEIMDDAITYLRVFFSGMTALTVYNMGTAVLNAVGDSKRPLYFLMLSSVLNVTGNLLFVLVFHMGVSGVAWSTVIAQVISAVLVVWVLCRAEGDYRLELRALRLHSGVLKGITRIGLPGGIQQTIIGLSNIIVQSYVNGLGATLVAGYSAASKLDAFIALPVATLALTVTTFVGQNLGAHQVARARQGTRYSLMLGLASTIFLSAIVLAFGTTLLRIFSTDPEVVEAAYAFLKVFAPMYCLLCLTQIVPGALRGAGDVRFPTVACIFCFVVLRQIYLFFVTKVIYTPASVALGYPLTWGIAGIAILIYYRRSNWDRFLAT